MADYTVHLGFNWNSPTIGAIWGSSPDETKRFLLYALTTGTTAPLAGALFNFASGDAFSFVIWDLSTSAWSGDDAPQLALYAGLAEVDAPPTTIVPSAYLRLPAGAQVVATPPAYFWFPSITYRSPPPAGYACPWGEARGQSVNALGPVTILADDVRFKLSFRLDATGAQTRSFYSDPEVIIGSGGAN